MDRQTWADLSIFAAVAEARSFTRAAAKLGVTQSTLSHAIRAMEERLGVRLLNRSTRSVAPTEAGERLLAQLGPAIERLDDALRLLDDDRSRPAGRLRISAHRTAAIHVLAQKLPAFRERYPDIQVELAVEDGLVDIIAQSFDAGVRHEHVLDQGMVSVRISAALRSMYVATPGYWRQMGVPREPKDLMAHRCLVYRTTSSGAIMQWRFERDKDAIVLAPPPALISNDTDVLIESALGGMGVTWALEEQVRRHLGNRELVPVLDEWAPILPPNFLYYPSKRQMSRALRVFVDDVRSSK
jgi:DNA-binding transcriptional LysR family regulator